MRRIRKLLRSMSDMTESLGVIIQLAELVEGEKALPLVLRAMGGDATARDLINAKLVEVKAGEIAGFDLPDAFDDIDWDQVMELLIEYGPMLLALLMAL